MFRTVFTTLHFLHNSQMGPKIKCYITQGWKGLQGINTLAYWGPFKVKRTLGWNGLQGINTLIGALSKFKENYVLLIQFKVSTLSNSFVTYFMIN
jgi:hypothetical protein